MSNKEAPKGMPLKLNITSETQLKIGGKMNETDAGMVGKMQAAALIIAAVAMPILAIAALAYAVR